jgi:hypothetical protein
MFNILMGLLVVVFGTYINVTTTSGGAFLIGFVIANIGGYYTGMSLAIYQESRKTR